MKRHLLFLFGLFMSTFVLAQTPQGISHQAVIRNVQGELITNSTIGIQVSILQGSLEGVAVYVERHTAISNANGLISFIIGEGDFVDGVFENIDWSDGPYFLKNEVDPDGGINYTISGIVELLSVPYALFSANGIQNMTLEQRIAFENPHAGMVIYNTTSNCLNYFNGTSWFEVCGDCTPLPNQADAGPDQHFTDETSNTFLQANEPVFSTGTWSIINGNNGDLEDINNPNTLFTGLPCVIYTLKWTISNPCGSTEDVVNIHFDPVPTIANAGSDQEFLDNTLSTTIAANTPDVGEGVWSIVSGNGGIIDEPSNPITEFLGEHCETYLLKWTISTPCSSNFDEVTIVFNSTPEVADAGNDQVFLDNTTSTILAANIPEIGIGEWTIISGEGGVINESDNPASQFSGLACEDYTLMWAITTPCHVSEDEVFISFNDTPAIADAGQDQLYISGTWTNLDANIPENGTGLWEIISGEGGSLVDANNPKTLFLGQNNTVYELSWTISTECSSSVDFMTVSFGSLPTVTTSETTNITANSAYSGGNVVSQGSGPVTVRGVCWSTSPNPTLANNEGFTIDGEGLGAFISFLSGLTHETTYYVRAFATNNVGTAYGGQVVFNTSEQVTDNEGNAYQTVIIGNQEWMAENLRVTKYNNGDAIPTGLSDEDWGNTTEGAYAIYNNDNDMLEAYGKLYNWHAVDDSRGLCPQGWSVPSDTDWTALVDYVVSQGFPNEWTDPNGAGNALKSCRQVNSPLGGECNTSTHPRWNSDGIHYGLDEFGFSALPGGYRNTSGNYNDIGSNGYWWSSSEYSSASAWYRYMGSSTGDVYRGNYTDKRLGLSVRCFRDITEEPTLYNLNLAVHPIGAGSVMGEGEYLEGAEVSITATANEGWAFSHWTGDIEYLDDADSAEAVVTMPADNVTLTAVFQEEDEDPVFTCGDNISFTYNGEEVTYGTILRNGLCWLDRNLGASRVPISSTDSQGYGDLFQWGRLDDGHQDRTSSTTPGPINQDVPGHGSFLTVGPSPWDWRSPHNNALWQGEDGINNPCPEGWRVPTEAELNAERQSWSSNNSAGAYASTLKWPVGGYRHFYNSALETVGSSGHVWSSSVSGTLARPLYFISGLAFMDSNHRAHGMSVRCVRDN